MKAWVQGSRFGYDGDGLDKRLTFDEGLDAKLTCP